MGSMIYSLYMMIIFPIIGKLGDVYSLQFSFKVLAIIASTMAMINIIVNSVNKKEN